MPDQTGNIETFYFSFQRRIQERVLGGAISKNAARVAYIFAFILFKIQTFIVSRKMTFNSKLFI